MRQWRCSTIQVSLDLALRLERAVPPLRQGQHVCQLAQADQALPECGLDFGFARADDGPAFFALCLTAFPLTFFAVWLEWPIAAVVGSLAHLRADPRHRRLSSSARSGWLVASQYVNKATEAGTEGLWPSWKSATNPEGVCFGPVADTHPWDQSSNAWIVLRLSLMTKYA
jgi:uncharacterized protein (DUF983 family)